MKKALKIITVNVAILVAAGALFITWAIWPGDDSEIRQTVDAIAIPQDWVLTHEKVTPPLNLCLEKLGCPSLERKRELDRAYSKEELQEVFSAASISLEIDGICEIPEKDQRIADRGLCSGLAYGGEYDYQLYQTTANSRQGFAIQLFVQGKYDR